MKNDCRTGPEMLFNFLWFSSLDIFEAIRTDEFAENTYIRAPLLKRVSNNFTGQLQ